MISYEEALALTMASAKRTRSATLPLTECVGRVLAADLATRFPLPRFDNSAVDGYVTTGPGSVFRQVRTIGAGEPAGPALQQGECARIFTGAAIPANAFGVAMQEDAIEADGEVRVCVEIQQGQNIRRAGEEFAQGATALASGTVLNAAGVALAASLGCHELRVYMPPRVGILVTGAELATPGLELGEGQIYESNSTALQAALKSLGIVPASSEVTGDDHEATAEAVRLGLDRCDLLITTGGVSVGDRDIVKPALASLGVETVYWSVALKPGKPVYFGTRGDQAVFGLPGNPMSVLATFVMLVQPYLKACMGFPNPLPTRMQAVLLSAIHHKPGRREFIPANTYARPEGLQVLPILSQGSHMLGGLARADALVDIPEEAEEVPANQIVWVIPFGQVAI